MDRRNLRRYPLDFSCRPNRRNTGLCFIAVDGDELVGTILCGHDGRRGILRHLAVTRGQRRTGIAKRLVRASLDALAAQGIRKCNIFVMDDNQAGLRFWEHIGFRRLDDDYRTLQFGTTVAFGAAEK